MLGKTIAKCSFDAGHVMYGLRVGVFALLLVVPIAASAQDNNQSTSLTRNSESTCVRTVPLADPWLAVARRQEGGGD